VDPIVGPGFLKYTHVIAAFHQRTSAPVCFVTLESGPGLANVLGVFERDGRHSNCGLLSGPDLESTFERRGIELLKERLGLEVVEPMHGKRPAKPWWKVW
jgi:hypothetical protein